MLSLYKKRKILISVLTTTFMITPLAVWGARQATTVNDVNAITYQIPSGHTTFTDPNFYDCVAAKFAKDFPEEEIPSTGFSDEQLSRLTSLSCSGFNTPDEEKIQDLSGLEKLTGLVSLYLSYNKITEIDISQNTLLRTLSIGNNSGITNLVLSGHPSLVTVSAGSISSLETVDVSNISTLKTLDIGGHGTSLSSVNVLGCTNLESLDVHYFTQSSNRNDLLTDLDLSENPNLVSLIAYGNNLSDENIVVNNPKLKTLYLGYKSTSQGSKLGNSFSDINLSNNVALESLYLTYNQLSSLDVSSLTELQTLAAAGNSLTALDLSNNAKLTYLDLGWNHTCSNLYDLGDGYACSRSAGNMISSIDLSGNPLLKTLKLANNQLSCLDLSAQSDLTYLDLGNNNLASLDLSAQEVLAYVNIGNNTSSGNNHLNESSFKLAGNNMVTTLWAEGNLFTEVPNHVSSLKFVSFASNDFERFSTESMPELRGLYLGKNHLSSLDISGSPDLTGLSASSNNLTEFDASNNSKIIVLALADNAIFDFTSIENLELGGEHTVDWDGTYKHSGRASLRNQAKTVESDSETYVLPELFTQVKTEGWGANFSPSMYTSDDFRLVNATLSDDGKSITIIDTKQPATIKVNGGAADGSILTVNYIEPEEIKRIEPGETKHTEPEEVEEEALAVPNTGLLTSGEQNPLSPAFLPFMIITLGLTTGAVLSRNKKTHRKFDD